VLQGCKQREGCLDDPMHYQLFKKDPVTFILINITFTFTIVSLTSAPPPPILTKPVYAFIISFKICIYDNIVLL